MIERPDARIEQVDVSAVLALRQRVLRDGTPSGDPGFDGDDDPATVHLAVLVDRDVVAVSTWMARPWPDEPRRPAVQLRGMATLPAAQGSGLGGVLLEEGVRRAFDAGAGLVWANARDSALRFYRRHAFEVVGDGFHTRDTGLPHHRIVRRAAP